MWMYPQERRASAKQQRVGRMYGEQKPVGLKVWSRDPHGSLRGFQMALCECLTLRDVQMEPNHPVLLVHLFSFVHSYNHNNNKKQQSTLRSVRCFGFTVNFTETK